MSLKYNNDCNLDSNTLVQSFVQVGAAPNSLNSEAYNFGERIAGARPLPLNQTKLVSMKGSGSSTKLLEIQNLVRPKVNEIIMNKGVRVTVRDKTILKLCYEHSFILSRQIQRYVFPERSEITTRKRLWRLEQGGLLVGRQAISGLEEFGRRYELTSNAKDLVANWYDGRFSSAGKTHISDLNHEVLLMESRLRLSELLGAKSLFSPECFFKQLQIETIPDGSFALKDSGISFAIELENSLKSKTRFIERNLRWDEHPALSFVLFITTSPFLKGKLMEFTSGFMPPLPFYFCELPSLLSSKNPEVCLANGSQFSLLELVR